MSNSFPALASIRRHSSLLSASALLLAVWATATGQTAPQLLPYTSKLIAGSGAAAIASGGICPVSGYTSTDAYGDGCLATEIQLVAPRYATADSTGAVFFSDFTNGLIRRVDPLTGIVTAVAGGAASSPASGATCGAFTSTDARGDGCLSTAVHLSKPVGLVFSPAGDLYFADAGYAIVRKIAATGGLIPAGGGVISVVDGSPAGTFGYTANNSSGNIVAATSSFLDDPYDVAFDASGNLYISDYFKSAVVVVNTNASTTTTVTGVSIPPGTVAKILGASTTGGSTCPNSPASPNGCNFGLTTFGVSANSSEVDNPYAAAVDGAGNVYFTGEYYNFAGKITASTGIVTQYAGIQNAPAKKIQRAPAGTFGIGSDFGIAADANSNVYITDASNGVVWRVDGAGQSMYVVAGGATTPCSTVVDAYGDGCPATQAIFGSSGTGNFAVTASPGIFGVNVDANSNLYIGDTITNLIREVASGTSFGSVGANQTVTQTLDIHFATGDTPAATAYSIIAGTVFSVGTASCTTNSDGTTDCLLPLTASPTALGAFSGTLQVKSALGGVATFALSGTSVSTPVTRTAVSYSSATGTACGATTTYATPFATTLTATITSSGSPTGTVTFYSNGAQIGTPQNVNNGIATLAFTFTAANTYKITAIYSGDSYFHTSTATTGVTFTTSPPTFTASAIVYQQNTVAAGQTGLYSFNVVQSVYTGTIAFTATGLPPNSSVTFSPQTLAATGCSTTNTVAVSILTQQGAVSSSFAAGSHGIWSILSMAAGFSLALLIGIRRRHAALRFGQLWMVLALLLGTSGIVACGSGVTAAARTPAGAYTVTITATGSNGITSSFTVPLTVK